MLQCTQLSDASGQFQNLVVTFKIDYFYYYMFMCIQYDYNREYDQALSLP